MLKINKESNDEILVIRICGRIDTVNSETLKQELISETEKKEKEKIILDFSEVDYISSSGLRVLLAACKNMPAEGLVIKNASENVLEIFDVTGFTDILKII